MNANVTEGCVVVANVITPMAVLSVFVVKVWDLQGVESKIWILDFNFFIQGQELSEGGKICGGMRIFEIRFND